MSQSYFKKGAAAILAGVLSVSSVVPAFAYDPGDTANCDHVTTAGGVGNAAVMLTVEDREEPVIFSAYVPAELPIAIDANGDVTVPQNAKIINGVETLPIEVEAIDVTMEDDWTLASMDTDMSLEAKDTKKVAMEVLGQDLSDTDSFSPAKIEAGSKIALNMKANLPDQSASSQTKIATIGFTVNWWEDDVDESENTIDWSAWENPADTTLNLDELYSKGYRFNSSGGRMFFATGTSVQEKSILIPSHVITGRTRYVFGGIADTEAFANNTYIEEVYFTSSNQILPLPNGAFANCTNLKTIVLPKYIYSFPENLFEGCTSLKTIVVPEKKDSVTGAPWGAPNMTAEDVIWIG